MKKFIITPEYQPYTVILTEDIDSSKLNGLTSKYHLMRISADPGDVLTSIFISSPCYCVMSFKDDEGGYISLGEPFFTELNKEEQQAMIEHGEKIIDSELLEGGKFLHLDALKDLDDAMAKEGKINLLISSCSKLNAALVRWVQSYNPSYDTMNLKRILMKELNERFSKFLSNN